MSSEKRALVEALYRYPVKGLSPQLLNGVELTVGETVPCDRVWALQDERGRFDPQAPRDLPKVNYLMLMRDEALASLKTTFDEDTSVLVISLDGKEVVRGALTTSEGRAAIEEFIARYMSASVRGSARIVSAAGHSFSDVAEKCVHIINRASLEELSKAAGAEINPLRFRPNVVVEGWPAWSEFSLMDKEIRLGTARLKVFQKTVRCAATNVNPDIGTRDRSLPDLLLATWGHTHFGVYAKVISAGRVCLGDEAAV